MRFPRYLIPCGSRGGGFESKALKEKSKNREFREAISSGGREADYAKRNQLALKDMFYAHKEPSD